MTASEMAQDGTTLLQTLTSPARGLGAVVARRRIGLALAIATAASLATAAVVVPRMDYDAVAEAKLRAAGPDAQEPTPYEREEAAATARKIGHIAGWAAAAALPSLLALGAAAFLFVGFRVAGAAPAFRSTVAVTAHGMLPLWLGGLLSIPAAVAAAPIAPGQAGRLLPSSLASWVHGVPPALSAALSAVDVFGLWALALVATGMARAAGTSRTRAAAVTVVLFLAYVALFKVVPAASGGPGPR